MNTFKYSLHFSGLGWTPIIENFGLHYFPNRQIEAIKLYSPSFDLNCTIKNREGEFTGTSDNEIIGTIGKSIPILRLKIADNNNTQHTARLYYRVFLRSKGWTKICSSGEWTEDGSSILEGIQIWMSTDSEKEASLQKANMYLTSYLNRRDNLFIKNADNMLLQATSSYENLDTQNVIELLQGIVLPLQAHPLLDRDGQYFLGGVCNKHFEHVAGIDRHGGQIGNWSCNDSYTVNSDEITYRDETVIFGGIVFAYFGHTLTESLARFWYIAEHPNNNLKIVVLVAPGHENFSMDIFKLIGINEERLEVISTPTKFARIIIPQEAFRMFKDYSTKINSVYDTMLANTVPANYRKIYLTRTAFARTASEKGDGINEEYFEKFYKKRGYTVISLEKYPFAEQVAIISGADEIACTLGTLSHMAVIFCRKNAKVTIIMRTNVILRTQILLEQCRNIYPDYVDGSMSFLPTDHWSGIFLYGPTKHWVDYLNAKDIHYEADEVEFDYSNCLYSYLKRWCENYNSLPKFNTISHIDLFDLLNGMNSFFNLPQISRNTYVTKVKQRENTLIAEKKELEKLCDEYAAKLKIQEEKLQRINEILIDNEKQGDLYE